MLITIGFVPSPAVVDERRPLAGSIQFKASSLPIHSTSARVLVEGVDEIQAQAVGIVRLMLEDAGTAGLFCAKCPGPTECEARPDVPFTVLKQRDDIVFRNASLDPEVDEGSERIAVLCSSRRRSPRPGEPTHRFPSRSCSMLMTPVRASGAGSFVHRTNTCVSVFEAASYSARPFPEAWVIQKCPLLVSKKDVCTPSRAQECAALLCPLPDRTRSRPSLVPTQRFPLWSSPDHLTSLVAQAAGVLR
jgi:hypothetical protein